MQKKPIIRRRLSHSCTSFTPSIVFLPQVLWFGLCVHDMLSSIELIVFVESFVCIFILLAFSVQC